MRVSTSALEESWLSGLRRTTGNRVWGDTSPRVQIPNSPHRSMVKAMLIFLFPFSFRKMNCDV